jgi:uncharacterized protein YaiI (UPF0178 family)
MPSPTANSWRTCGLMARAETLRRFGPKDRSRFLEAMERVIREAQRSRDHS